MDMVTESAELTQQYDSRYRTGYLDGAWSAQKKIRLQRLVAALPLPKTGVAIDVGCGDGEITAVLRAALPQWRVCGIEISREAVGMARERHPGCEFYVADEAKGFDESADLIFTHHVLEHVSDVAIALGNAQRLAKKRAAMLHILPCGNPGSFEHSLCVLMHGGVDPQRGNRFFFEDPTHMRRLSSAELIELARSHTFSIKDERYANQYYGALDWITQSAPGVLWKLTDYRRARDAHARRALLGLRVKLLMLWMLRIPAAFVELRVRRRRRKGLKDYAVLAIGALLYPFSKPMDWLIKRRACAEWRDRSAQPNGSEMYLYFERG